MTDESRIVWLARVMAIATLTWLMVTWRLWSPAAHDPQIPWLTILCHVPRWIDFLLLIAVACGCAGWLLPRYRNALPTTAIVYWAAWAGLLSLDQARLQPWAWQLLCLSGILALAPPTLALKLTRWLTISIYVYSALSKFDAAYLTAHGRDMFNAIMSGAGWKLPLFRPEITHWLPLIFPTGELLIALLLSSRRFRRWGVLGSLLMHSILLWVLGFVLHHDWGVVLWNLFFMAQVILAFIPDVPSPQVSPTASWKPKLARAAIAFVCFAPLLERIGYWDHWPAWAVYSSRPEIVRVQLLSGFEKLPAEWQQALRAGDFDLEGRELNLDGWSYNVRHCPIYPQLRYRIALARAVTSAAGVQDHVRWQLLSSPNPWTGQRQEIAADDPRLNNFWANTQPRR